MKHYSTRNEKISDYAWIIPGTVLQFRALYDAGISPQTLFLCKAKSTPFLHKGKEPCIVVSVIRFDTNQVCVVECARCRLNTTRIEYDKEVSSFDKDQEGSSEV